MFDLSDRPLVWIPVKWSVLRPGAKATSLAVETEALIEVEVDVLDRNELVELFAGYFEEGTVAAVAEAAAAVAASDDSEEAEDEPEALPEPAPSERELEVKRFLRVVKNWRKFKDGGRPVEFNEANVRRLLAVPGFASAFEGRYLAACAGKSDIRRGN